MFEYFSLTKISSAKSKMREWKSGLTASTGTARGTSEIITFGEKDSEATLKVPATS